MDRPWLRTGARCTTRLTLCVLVSVGVLAVVDSATTRLTAAAAVIPESGYVALTPARLLDTRIGRSTIDGAYSSYGAIGPAGQAPRTSLRLRVVGRAGVPVAGARAVALNVTATNPNRGSFVTVWPAGQPQPGASTVNFEPGQTVANLTVALIGVDGSVDISNFAGSVDLAIDVVGWFPAGGDLEPLSPARLLDTRSGRQTIDGRYAGVGAVASNASISIPVTSRGAVPTTDVAAVLVNITATNPTEDGYLTAWSGDGAVPGTSSVNFRRDQSVANLAVVSVSDRGTIAIYNYRGGTDVVIDVVGWYGPGSDMTPVAPARLADTRSAAVTIDGRFSGTGPIGPAAVTDIEVTGRAGIPLTGVSAVIVNITATASTNDGFLTVYPTGANRPDASTVNFTAGATVANLSIVRVGAGGKISVFNFDGRTDVVIDVIGYVDATLAKEVAVSMVASPVGTGAWAVGDRGTVLAIGGARADLGGLAPDTLLAGERVSAIIASPTGNGYLLVTSLGRVFARGDAVARGNAVNPAGPVVDAVATPSGNGYSLITSAGDVLPFGDANNSTDLIGLGITLNQPITSVLIPTNNSGYWMLAQDSGVFTIGGAFYNGSPTSVLHNATEKIFAWKGAYGLVDTSGQTFLYRDGGGGNGFEGSVAGPGDAQFIVSAAPKNDYSGYWLLDIDGTVYDITLP